MKEEEKLDGKDVWMIALLLVLFWVLFTGKNVCGL